MNPRAKLRGSRRWRGGGSLAEDQKITTQAGSRRDEFAADAVAAQFVDAGALAGALKKIEAAGAPRDKLHARAGAYAHAYFSNDDGPSRWLRTHPPSRRGSPRSSRARRPDALRRRPGRGSPPRPSRSRSRKFPYF